MLKDVENFVPIGDGDNAFTGVFDGNGYKITGLKITGPQYSYEGVGLFGNTSGAVIKNLTVDGDVTGYQNVGILVGYASNTDIINCHSSGIVTGSTERYAFGGLVGYLYKGNIIDSSSSATVSGYGQVGGLVGYVRGSATVYNSFATGNVSSTGNSAGGLVGRVNQGGLVVNSYATGSVTGNGEDAASIGGFAGSVAIDGRIVNSYSTGNVSGYASVGGFIGNVSVDAMVENSYSTGKAVSQSDTAGGFAGIAGENAEIIASFWDKNKSGMSTAVGTNEMSTAVGTNESTLIVQVTGLTSSQMKQASTFKNAGWSDKYWDFSTGAAPDVKKVDLEKDPTAGYIEIYTVEDFKNIENHLSSQYVLMADLDLSGIDWTPIGNSTNTFTGKLDGNGHKITGFNSTGDKERHSLFNAINYATIKNLVIEDATITNTSTTYDNYVGILAGYAAGATISNIKVSNVTIEAGENGNALVGALVGSAWATDFSDIEITDLYINGRTTMGGIAGELEQDGTITNSYVQGTIRGSGLMGGLVGSIEYGADISNSSTKIDFIGLDDPDGRSYENYKGGIVGLANYTTITNCSSVGTLKGDETVDEDPGCYYFGGIAGGIKYTDISNSYVSYAYYFYFNDQWIQDGTHESWSTNGWSSPIVYNDSGNSTVTNCYWDKEWGGLTESYIDAAGSASSTSTYTGNAGLTTSELADSSNFAGWDLSLWDFSSGKPVLKYDLKTDDDSAGGSSNPSTITGSVDTDEFADRAFWGQKSGTITFDDGTAVNISSTDTRSQVLEKINAAGLIAETDENGKIKITGSAGVVSDTSGFTQFYGLASAETSYDASPTTKTESREAESTLTGSVDTTDLSGDAFWGQTSGSINFSDGTKVNISATDSLSDILNSMNNAGLNAVIDGSGKISITSVGSKDLYIVSDNTGISEFYGLKTEQTGSGTAPTPDTPETPETGGRYPDRSRGSRTGLYDNKNRSRP